MTQRRPGPWSLPSGCTAHADLARAVQRRCLGATLWIGACSAEVRARFREQDTPLQVVDAVGLRAPEIRAGAFASVVLCELLGDLAEHDALDLIRAADARLEERGRLLVVEPNGALQAPSTAFTAARLKKLLKKVEQPRMYADQPYRWLLFGIERGRGLERTLERRCAALLELCRGDVLELGCGPGHLSALIAARGHAVVGVDLNQRKIERARREHPGVDFVQGDILTLSVDRRYDTVVLAEVLEHVDVEIGDAMLDRAWDFVAPGGRLIVSVPNEHLVPHKNHVREFTLEDLRALVGRFGPVVTSVDQPFKWLQVYVDRS